MESERNIEVETLITYDEYKEFYLFSMSKVKKYKKMPMLINSICIIGISISILTMILWGVDIMSLLILLVLIMGVLLRVFITNYIPKKYFSSSANFFNKPVKYKFTEEQMYVENNNEVSSTNSEIKYDGLYKVYELESKLYIYINTNQAHIVSKNNLSMENIQWLRSIFEAKLGKKYYKYF